MLVDAAAAAVVYVCLSNLPSGTLFLSCHKRGTKHRPVPRAVISSRQKSSFSWRHGRWLARFRFVSGCHRLKINYLKPPNSEHVCKATIQRTADRWLDVCITWCRVMPDLTSCMLVDWFSHLMWNAVDRLDEIRSSSDTAAVVCHGTAASVFRCWYYRARVLLMKLRVTSRHFNSHY